MSSPETEKDGVDLLLVLDSVVHQTGALPGIGGEVSFGIMGDDGSEAWWSAHFSDGKVETAFLDDEPETADVVFVIGEREANAIMDKGRPPDDGLLLEVEGDEALLDRFLDLYFTERSMVDVRASQTARAPKKRSRR
jgi:hypothetical protein